MVLKVYALGLVPLISSIYKGLLFLLSLLNPEGGGTIWVDKTKLSLFEKLNPRRKDLVPYISSTCKFCDYLWGIFCALGIVDKFIRSLRWGKGKL